MMHSLLALIVSAIVTQQECPRHADCPMPRIHYTADTVYVIAGHTGPVFIHAASSEPIDAPLCPACNPGVQPANAIAEPSDDAATCVTDVVVHAGAKNHAQRYFTGQTE